MYMQSPDDLNDYEIYIRRIVQQLGFKHVGVFQKIVLPQNGWFIMENPIF